MKLQTSQEIVKTSGLAVSNDMVINKQKQETHQGNDKFQAQSNLNTNSGKFMELVSSEAVVLKPDLPKVTGSSSYTQYQGSVAYQKKQPSRQGYQQTQTIQVAQTFKQPQTNNQARYFQQGDAQLKGYQQQTYQQTYQGKLRANTQVQINQEPVYSQFSTQKYYQPYQSSSYTAQEYQQPYQGSSYAAQKYQQPYQGSSYQYQNWQTSGDVPSTVPTWKTSYTPLSGEGDCYNKCSPSCNANENGGSCQQSCQTACNISPTCGRRNQIQFAGQTMVCGRRGYNSEQVISGFYATSPRDVY